MRANATCLTFTRPEPALELFERSNAVELCVVDFALGGGWTGGRFAGALRARRCRRIPALVLVSGTLEDVPSADRRLFDAAYPKSMDPRTLLAELLRFTRVEAKHPRSYLRLTPAGREAAERGAASRSAESRSSE